MEGSLKELSLYRLQRAEEMLVAAEENLHYGQFGTSLNRSYYAVFHAMRAVNSLKGFDSSKHSGVIAYFNKMFLKDGQIDKSMSHIIKDTAYFREKSDYDDFFVAEKEEAEEQLENARRFIRVIKQYILTREDIDITG